MAETQRIEVSMKFDTNTALLTAGVLGIGAFLYLRRRTEEMSQEVADAAVDRIQQDVANLATSVATGVATGVAPQMSGYPFYMGQTGFQGRSLAPYVTARTPMSGARPRAVASAGWYRIR